MAKNNSKQVKALIIFIGIFIFISLLFGLIQLGAFVYLFKETPGMLDLFLFR